MAKEKRYNVNDMGDLAYKPTFPFPPSPKELKTNPKLPYELYDFTTNRTVGAFADKVLAEKICKLLNK